MITKTYESPNSIISNITLIVNGRPRILNFTAISEYEGSRTGHGSILKTSDEKLQYAIEHSRLFGTKVRLFKVENVVVEEKKPEAKSTEPETKEETDKTVYVPLAKADSPNEAREYMHNEFGIEMRKMPNIKSIINAAKERNVVFECLKDK